MMSPSDDLWQRLTTVSVMRWLKMSIVPLPGCIVTVTFTIAAIWPDQAPAHETTNRGVMRVRLPDRSSRSVAATIRLPSRSMPTRRW